MDARIDIFPPLSLPESAAADLAQSDAIAGGPSSGGRAPGRLAGVPPRLLTVLVVEDNTINQRLALEILTRRGHRVVVAENGRQAVERFQTERFDLVLMDVQMPEMNGLAATRAIRGLERTSGRRIPIMAMTAHAMSGDRERCLEAGMDDYLTKPIRAEALIARVECPAVVGIAAPADVPVEGREPAAPGAFDATEALARVDGDELLLAEIGGLFLQDIGGLVAELREAATAADYEQLARSAHRLKGSVLTFGAAACADAALVLERMGRTGRLENAPAALAALDREIARLIEGLRPLVARQPVSR